MRPYLNAMAGEMAAYRQHQPANGCGWLISRGWRRLINGVSAAAGA